MADQGTTIIIKKIKKGGHGHHGGAWKVAYADFVTAMMAFFLLLWLLSSTSEGQKEGIADYFTPTVGIKDEMGIGFKGGETQSEEGIQKGDKAPPGIMIGQVQQGSVAGNPDKLSPVESDADAQLFEKGEESLKKAFEEDPNFREFKDNVIVQQTPEGLKIDVIDDDKVPMFEAGSAILTPFGQKILRRIADVVVVMPNYISIAGHTDNAPLNKDNGQFTNWELSAARANSSRRFLLTTRLEAERINKVVGMADRDPIMKDDPTSPRNRRITLVLLKGQHLDLQDKFVPAPRELLSVPKADETKIKDATSPQPAVVVPVAPPAAQKPAAPVKVDVAPTSVAPAVIKSAPVAPKPAAPASRNQGLPEMPGLPDVNESLVPNKKAAPPAAPKADVPGVTFQKTDDFNIRSISPVPMGITPNTPPSEQQQKKPGQ